MKDNHKADVSHTDEFNKTYQEMVKEADERFKNHKRPKVSGVCQECVFAVKDDNPHCGLRGFRNDFNVKSCSAKNNTIPNGFELQKDGYFSWLNKKEYPKTYEECCKVLGIDVRDLDILDNMLDTSEIIYRKNLDRLLNSFRKLIICRDAYWKLYGEEMGLGKPWEPTEGEMVYSIYRHSNKIGTEMFLGKSVTFEFPTPEMRDAFYENFKELINECKELL